MLFRNGISQKHLEDVVQGLFPTANILPHFISVNARQDATLKNPKTGQHLEVDIWLPDLHLCFEFQDVYHYSTTWYAHRSLDDIKQADSLKNDILFNKTQTLVYVPYWWTGDGTSLKATISFLRPDLLKRMDNEPIPINPPPAFDSGGVPDIGDLMLASFPKEPPISLTSIGAQDPWLYFDCKIRYSRTGGTIPLPACSAYLGDEFIDGELWSGRGAYGDAIGVLLSDHSKQSLAFSRHIGFDSPAPQFHHTPFEYRIAVLLSSVPVSHPNFDSIYIVAFRARCTQTQTLFAWAKHVIDREGEGVVLRQQGSFYVPGRSSFLFKFKSVADSEALVVSSTGEATKLQLPSGRVITVAHKEQLKKGEVVTFGYTNTTQLHNPANIAILRIRKDLTWRDVLAQGQKDGNAEISSPPSSKRSVEDFASKSSKAYYMQSSMQNFFENFAKRRNFNARIAANWYNISRKDVFQERGGITIIGKYFKGSLIRALRHVFPNIGLERDKFISREKYFWIHEANRKKFFIEYARREGFDPLVADNWYARKSRFGEIRNECIHLVDSYYGGSVSRTLLHVFPDIGLDINKLYLPGNTWTSKVNRRNMLITYAKARGVDPRNAQDWYSFNIYKAGTTKEIRAILGSFYHGSIAKCLMDLFPELNLSSDKFLRKQSNYWTSPTNRRNFFIDFARARGFDPLVANNWKNITCDTVKQAKGGPSVLEYYKSSCASALIDLFPNIGLREVYPAVKLQKGSKRIRKKRMFVI